VGLGKTVPTTNFITEQEPKTKITRTRQTPMPEGGEAVTLQQVVEAMQILQRKNEESRRQAQKFLEEQEHLCAESLTEHQRLRDEFLAEQ